MISRISANHVNVELMRFLKSLYLSELSWFILILVLIKMFVLILVTQQFFCVNAENRGKWCCTNKTALERKSSLKGWKNIRNMIGPSPDLSSQPSFSGTGSPRRIDRIIAHHNQFKNWKSSLRARDIQLLLRLSRNMPNNKHLSNFTEADKDVVDIAKCVLGTGGVIDIHLNQSLKKVLENEGDELRKELLEGTDNVVKVASRIEYLVSIEKQKMNQRASDLYQTDLLRKKAVGERKKHEKMEENSSEEKISTIYRTSKSFDEPSTILSQPEADLTVGSKFESCFGEGTIKCLNEDGSLVFETVWGGMVYAKHISALT